jgi:hypothetical protein
MKKMQTGKKLALKKQAVAMLKTNGELAIGMERKTIIVTSRTVCNPSFGCPPPDTIVEV